LAGALESAGATPTPYIRLRGEQRKETEATAQLAISSELEGMPGHYFDAKREDRERLGRLSEKLTGLWTRPVL
jgi:hypothetical protein